MGISSSIKAFGVSKALDYLERDPDANLPKLMDWVDAFGGSLPLRCTKPLLTLDFWDSPSPSATERERVNLHGGAL